ncbi:MAG TPA: MBL fold metallo-hydrolase [Gemmatimonadaceae bacterium]|nr:MBL fold metallo-hydrolase [Gemmatimonadaceae bacterium]
MTAGHHTARGYRNPWPDSEPRGLRDVIRWSLERRKRALPPDPAPGSIPIAAPTFAERVGADELSATWVGHSTVLLQLGAINILTDPMWSDRASPVSFAGPRRLVAAAFDLKLLPSIDVVLISHNHYDHLDKPTVRALVRRMPEAEWIVPLGLSPLLRNWGADRVREADWWQTLEIRTTFGMACISSTPAQHFSARGLWDRGRTLWCSWAVAAGTRRAFFAGDTAYHPEFPAIGERYGPFDLSMLPVGAYDPRWFMKTVHMNPPEALRAYTELAGPRAGELAMLPIHWGTFRLTDEPIEQPPAWTAQLWAGAGYERNHLWLMEHGETRRL